MQKPMPKDNFITQYPLALVTGSAHRVGKSLAMNLAEQGYGIIVHYHGSRNEAMETVKEIQSLGVPAFSIQADLTAEAGIRSLFSFIDSIIEKPELNTCEFSLLVNSAAIMVPADPKSISMELFDAAINLNLRAPFFCAQMGYQRMPAGSSIINISDVGSQKAWSGFPAYTISKAGLDSMTKILARSFAPKVRVNAIAPGFVLPPDEFPISEWDRLLGKLPIPREATLLEIESALNFLIKNEYITGQTIVIDGGYSLV